MKNILKDKYGNASEIFGAIIILIIAITVLMIGNSISISVYETISNESVVSETIGEPNTNNFLNSEINKCITGKVGKNCDPTKIQKEKNIQKISEEQRSDGILSYFQTVLPLFGISLIVTGFILVVTSLRYY